MGPPPHFESGKIAAVTATASTDPSQRTDHVALRSTPNYPFPNLPPLPAPRWRDWLRALGMAQAARLGAWYLGFDLSSRASLEKAVSKQRALGASKVPNSFSRRYDVRCETMAGITVFRARRRHNCQAVVGANNLPPPRVVYLHGGAFVFDLLDLQWNLVAALLDRGMAEIIIPLFLLAPEHRREQVVDSIRHFYRALLQQEGAPTVLMGDSSGGCQSLLLAQYLYANGLPMPGGLLLFSPALDLSFSDRHQLQLQRHDPFFKVTAMKNLITIWAEPLPAGSAEISPLFGDLHHLPPTMVFSGGWEIFASDAQRLSLSCPRVLHRHYPNMIHDWVLGPGREARRACDEAALFIHHINRQLLAVD